MDRLKKCIERHRLVVFVAMAMLVASLLVAISMRIYYTSDAFRLDLSRPAYESRRSEINQDSKEKNNTFDAQGLVDKKVLNEFLTMYDDESKDALQRNAFNSEVLGDKELNIVTAETSVSAE